MLKPLHRSPMGLPIYLLQRMMPKIVGGSAMISSIYTVLSNCIILHHYSVRNISNLKTIRQQYFDSHQIRLGSMQGREFVRMSLAANYVGLTNTQRYTRVKPTTLLPISK